MKQIKGSELTQSEQRKALTRFTHRFTSDHKPLWANTPMGNGVRYVVQFASDKEWLANTLFWVKNDGTLSEKHSSCESSPTWPNNPELIKKVNSRITAKISAKVGD